MHFPVYTFTPCPTTQPHLQDYQLSNCNPGHKSPTHTHPRVWGEEDVLDLPTQTTLLLLTYLICHPNTLLAARLIFWPQAASVFALPTEAVRPTESMRRSVSEAALAQPEGLLGTDSLKTLTMKDLSFKGNSETSDTPEMSMSMETLGPSTPSDVNFFLRPENFHEEGEAKDDVGTMDRAPRVRAAFPEGFHPRRSSQGILHMPLYSSPIVKNPFMSPLLAPDSMLKTLPPVHIVVRTRPGRVPLEGGGVGHGCPGKKS